MPNVILLTKIYTFGWGVRAFEANWVKYTKGYTQKVLHFSRWAHSEFDVLKPTMEFRLLRGVVHER